MAFRGHLEQLLFAFRAEKRELEPVEVVKIVNSRSNEANGRQPSNPHQY